MTIPVSTFPVAVANLLTSINALVATDVNAGEVVVVLGNVGMDVPEGIYVGVSDPARPAAARRTMQIKGMRGDGGQNWLIEHYVIPVTVWTWTGSASNPNAANLAGSQAPAVTVLQRAWVLQSYVETAVREDPSLGIASPAVIAFPVQTNGGIPILTQGNDVGLGVQITSSVDVTATF